ncbi:MAG: YceI family protein [Taibaiella sp.]|jgi:polyisoprenoid-binding protein YceI
MNMFPRIRIMATLALVLTGGFLYAQSSYPLSGDCSIKIHGDSNLHGWEETAKKVSGSSQISWNSDGTFNVTALRLAIDVMSIKSTEGSTMNNKTYKALNASKNPSITFTLTTPLKSVANGSMINATGNLTIAGVTRQVVLHVKATTYGHSKIVFDGSQKIKMSEFGITPPTALLGTLKVADNVTIKFITNFATNII